MDRRLAGAGLARTGEAEQTRLRPWATVLRAPTSGGVVWMKAGGPATAFEAGLYGVLARVAPGDVLAPLALDVARGWVLLPDGGPSVGERLGAEGSAGALVTAVAQYGRLQRMLAPHAGELPGLGVPDMRPEVMPARFAEALAAAHASAPAGAQDRLAALAALDGAVGGWCETLAATPVPVSLDHNDLHAYNVLGTGPYRFYDWGDAVVAHAFAAMFVPLEVLDAHHGARARDAYLGAFDDLAPRAELEATLEVACRVAVIARALTWERALRSAREEGEPVDPRFAHAPYQQLMALLPDQ